MATDRRIVTPMPHDQPIRAAALETKVTFLETNSRAGVEL